MFFEKRCTNGGNLHRFEPRYDVFKSRPYISNTWGLGASQAYVDIIEASKEYKSVYVKDLCVWCGKEIPR